LYIYSSDINVPAFDADLFFFRTSVKTFKKGYPVVKINIQPP